MKKVTYICDKCKKELKPNELCTVNIHFTDTTKRGDSKYKVVNIEVCDNCRKDILGFIGENNFEVRSDEN